MQSLHKKFGIVRLWPGVNNAESEFISRCKVTSKAMGLECVEITSDGHFIDEPTRRATSRDLDFAINLHFSSPKAYDLFSFNAVWNPIKFYLDADYLPSTRNVASHDDFLSSGSQSADDHVLRLTRSLVNHHPFELKLYTTLSHPIHAPTLGAKKLFYIGINWERLSGKTSRHQELFRLLDESGLMRIYGPRRFQGVNVWEGYNSYVDELPFDGLSVVNTIAEAGISLVLSSQPHKDSGLMSMRLFESLAAGALIISDEHPFSKTHFGDKLLYIDSNYSAEKNAASIRDYMSWVDAHTDKALKMAQDAQALFLEHYTLHKNLSDIYSVLQERKKLLGLNYKFSANSGPVFLFLFVPVYSREFLEKHLESIRTQEYEHFKATLVIDEVAHSLNKVDIDEIILESALKVEIRIVSFYQRNVLGAQIRVKTGKIIADLISNLPGEASSVLFVGPHERLFSKHLLSLVSLLENASEKTCAAVGAVVTKAVLKEIKHIVHDEIDLLGSESLGFARYLFRASGLTIDLQLALPYLDQHAMTLLLSAQKLISAKGPSTLMYPYEAVTPVDDVKIELCILRDYSPHLFEVSNSRSREAVVSVESEPKDPEFQKRKVSALKVSEFDLMSQHAALINLRNNVSTTGTTLDDLQPIFSNQLFDKNWYLSMHRDIPLTGMSIEGHYMKYGHLPGFDPHPIFSNMWYLEQYPDVGLYKLNPLVHYLGFGVHENRNPAPFFDTKWYKETYPDVDGNGINPFTHYLHHGAEEGRNPGPDFDTTWYVKTYPESFLYNPLAHFIRIGLRARYEPKPK